MYGVEYRCPIHVSGSIIPMNLTATTVIDNILTGQHCVHLQWAVSVMMFILGDLWYSRVPPWIMTHIPYTLPSSSGSSNYRQVCILGSASDRAKHTPISQTRLLVFLNLTRTACWLTKQLLCPHTLQIWVFSTKPVSSLHPGFREWQSQAHTNTHTQLRELRQMWRFTNATS